MKKGLKFYICYFMILGSWLPPINKTCMIIRNSVIIKSLIKSKNRRCMQHIIIFMMVWSLNFWAIKVIVLLWAYCKFYRPLHVINLTICRTAWTRNWYFKIVIRNCRDCKISWGNLYKTSSKFNLKRLNSISQISKPWTIIASLANGGKKLTQNSKERYHSWISITSW